MAGEEVKYTCSVCRCEYTDDEGGVEGNFGMLPVAFCPTCFSCMCDMAQQFIDPEAYISPEQQEFLDDLNGYQYIVINASHGGFSLSQRAQIMYLDILNIPYHFEKQPDRERQLRYGDLLVVDVSPRWSDRHIPRDDPVLVKVVKELQAEADGDSANLKIVRIPAGIDWQIEDYDGWEWVSESHRTWR